MAKDTAYEDLDRYIESMQILAEDSDPSSEGRELSPRQRADLDRVRKHLLDAFGKEAQAQNDRLASAMQRVRDLHQYQPDAEYCDLCSNHGDITWPCATIRALDGAEK